MTKHEQKPESAEFRTREDQYNDPRFKRELECEIHIATGCRVTLYAEERPTGLSQCSTYDRWVGHWSTPNWHYPVTRFVSVEEMERAVSEAEARGAAEQRRKDAGEVEPVAWQYEVRGLGEWQNGEVGYGPDVWRLKCGYIKPDRDDTDYRSLSPLYDRPADVAALLDRVKELEDVVRGYLEASDLFDACTMICPPRALFEAKDMAMHHLRAAAIREGGEYV